MRFKIDWASLIVGSKFTVSLCFTLYLRAISKYKPRGAYIWRGDLTEGFLRYRFGGLFLKGLIHGRAYFRNFTVSAGTEHFRRLDPSCRRKVSLRKLFIDGRCFNFFFFFL